MRAAFYEKLGAARDVLHVTEMPDPIPGPGEVRVRVHASGVNPSDVKMRLGTGSAANEYPRIIPHSDGAGIVDAVGAGVPAARIGERVWLWNARWKRAFGTAADFVALPAEQAVPLPDNIDFATGACLGIPALTAWQAVETDGGVAGGEWVLVAGGAGSVGHYAIQMARARGARVIATVSSPAKAAHAAAAGAEIVIDRRAEDVVATVKSATGGKGVARVIEVDFAGNVAWLPQVVADYGLVVVYGSSKREAEVSFAASILGNVGYRFFIVYNQPPALRRRALAALTDMLRAGGLQHSIAATFPLAEIAVAHETVEAGRQIGNVVVEIAP
ncbi:MAG: NADPH:quinone reductase [Rhodospirillaceae bacterium]|nr:NADPH:quinone reductase [Rhodospirillaceae bacterium]